MIAVALSIALTIGGVVGSAITLLGEGDLGFLPWLIPVGLIGWLASWIIYHGNQVPSLYRDDPREYRRLLRTEDVRPLLVVRTVAVAESIPGKDAPVGNSWVRWLLRLQPEDGGSQVEAMLDAPREEPPLPGQYWLCAISPTINNFVVPIRRDPDRDPVPEADLESKTLDAPEQVQVLGRRQVVKYAAVTLSVTLAASMIGTAWDLNIYQPFQERRPADANIELNAEGIGNAIATLRERSGIDEFGPISIYPQSISAEVPVANNPRQIDQLDLRLDQRDAEVTRTPSRTLYQDEKFVVSDYSEFNPEGVQDVLQQGIDALALQDAKPYHARVDANDSVSGAKLITLGVQSEYGSSEVTVRTPGGDSPAVLLSTRSPGGEETNMRSLLDPDLLGQTWEKFTAAAKGIPSDVYRLGPQSFDVLASDSSVLLSCDDLGCAATGSPDGNLSTSTDAPVSTPPPSASPAAGDQLLETFDPGNLPLGDFTPEERRSMQIVFGPAGATIYLESPDGQERDFSYTLDGKPKP
ncbi:hypothetical protein [Haematomicrobium sanguinis]|uniref:hypothetical protein n=1 Tax=Haematomicrobium sanguinis TaxID=479106 RepID=UPI00047CF6D2|nr:hypothetical protein [Haematomicrobium sanguinis]